MLKILLVFLSFSAHAQFNGAPFRDDVAICTEASQEVSPRQQQIIAANMGQHSHRLYHWLWHATRNGWDGLTFQDRSLVQQISPNWGRHQPLCQPNSAAGEEFLRMHHQMIDFVRQQLVADGQPCIFGWETPPESLDTMWPVPQGAANDSSKGPVVARLIQVWAQYFNDDNYLRSKTLAEIGHLLEFSIHNNLHMRFANLPLPGDEFVPNFTNATPASLQQPSGFEGAQYRYLGNPYSAAVNPVFWKIHGYVDNVVVKWLSANGYTSIADNCGGDAYCYQWRSRWTGGAGYDRNPDLGEPVGGSGHHHGHDMGGGMSGGDADISSPIAKLMGEVSFRNDAFDRFLEEPRGGAGEDLGASPATPYDDPAEFVRQFGPCR